MSQSDHVDHHQTTGREDLEISTKTKLVLSIHEIQVAKKPATIAMIAATPPFATKDPAADEGVDEEAAAGDAPLVEAPPVGLGVKTLDAPAPPPPPATVEPPAALGAAAGTVLTGPPAAAAEVNGTGWGATLGPVGARPAAEHSRVCNMTAPARSAAPQFVEIQPAASAWN